MGKTKKKEKAPKSSTPSQAQTIRSGRERGTALLPKFYHIYVKLKIMIFFTVILLVKLIANIHFINWIDWTSGVAFGAVLMYWMLQIWEKYYERK